MAEALLDDHDMKECPAMGDATTQEPQPDDDLDAGAYIGREPELENETIPGGVKPGDERVAAYDSRPGVDGEPEDDDVVDPLRGGSGERGRPTDPPTNDDPLNGGSGILPPSED
jgi:hypothetical protein